MPDLSGFPALDLAIGLSFIFFLLAIFASAIQEFIASIFGLRARTLEAGLRNMLDAPCGEKDYVKDFYEHPLIDTLFKGDAKLGKTGMRRTKGPSYVSPRAFATYILDSVALDKKGRGVFAEGNKVLKELPPPIAARLKPLVDAAEGEVGKLRTNVEAWYDDTMARVSGWYKRKTQLILVLIGVVLVPAVNANALLIGERLWNDAAVRSAVVAQASAVATPPPKETTEDAQTRLKNAADAVNQVHAVGVPLGWRGDAVPHGVSTWATAVLGWLLTICAISLGAPFWFDLLGRFSRLRSSGKPETPLPATGSGKPNERVTTDK